MRKADNTPSANSSFAFADVPQGGGGYITGVDIHSSGRMAVGTDTAGCYLRDPTDGKWTTVFRSDTMNLADLPGSLYILNCGRVRFAPSNKNRFYSALYGFWFKIVIDPTKKLTDAGAITCTRFNLAAKYIQSGAGLNRWWMINPAVHPTDPDTVLLPTSNDGCYYTTNGGSTVSTITIPACIDPSGGLSPGEAGRMQYLVWGDQGNPLYWYAFAQGVGLHRSTTGAAGPYSLVTGSPTAGPLGASSLYGEADGTLWITGDARYTGSTGLWSLARGATTFTTYATGDVYRVQVDPFDNQRIVAIAEAGGVYSNNRGSAWGVSAASGYVAGGECVWREGGAIHFGGGFHFDPTTANRILWCSGFGVAVSTVNPYNGFPVRDYSKGIEGKIDNGFTIHPTTGQIMKYSWDLPQTKIDSLTQYINLTNDGPVEAGGLMIGGQIDYAIDDPTYWAASCGYGDRTCYSAQNGARGTWHSFAGGRPTTANAYGFTAEGACGSIGVGNKNNIVVAMSNDAYAAYTTNGGASWSPVLLSGSKDYSTNHAYYNWPQRKIIASDKTRPGVFAMLVGTAIPNTSNFTSPYGGLWVSTPDGSGNGGATWVKKWAGDLNTSGSPGEDTRQYYACQLEYVPGYSGELLYTAHADQSGDRFWWFTNDGTTRTETHSLVRDVTAFGFGKLPPGMTGRPAVYFYGKYNGVAGTWVTFDWFTTFMQVSDTYPNHYLFAPSCMAGDMTAFGRVLIGMTGKGSVYSTYQDVAHAT